jgi:hypothetical protein
VFDVKSKNVEIIKINVANVVQDVIFLLS